MTSSPSPRLLLLKQSTVHLPLINSQLLFSCRSNRTYLFKHLHLIRIGSNRIRNRSTERIASVQLEVIRSRVHIALVNSTRKAAAVVGREEVRVLVVAAPDGDLE